MREVHPDQSSYEIIWKEIICKEIDNYNSVYVGCLDFIPNVKDEIWKKYVELNTYCKTNYMKSVDGKLDRHKVAACYMAAISILRPIRFIKKVDNKDVPLALNESLAITVGLSLLRAFSISAIKKSESMDEKISDILISKFENGIKLPDKDYVNHGIYQENYANELHYAVSEGKLCVLSLAHELYLLELLTRII